MAIFVTSDLSKSLIFHFSKWYIQGVQVKIVNLLLISEVVFSLFLEVLEGILIGTFSAKPSSSSIAEAEATPE